MLYRMPLPLTHDGLTAAIEAEHNEALEQKKSGNKEAALNALRRKKRLEVILENQTALTAKLDTMPTFTAPGLDYKEDELQHIVLDEKPNELLTVKGVVKSKLGPTKVTVYNNKTGKTSNILLQKQRDRLGLSTFGRRTTGKAFKITHPPKVTATSKRGGKRRRYRRRTRKHRRRNKTKKKK